MPMYDLDAIDCNILETLQKDARISNVELAEKVNLSPSPCLRRVRRLEAEGTIRSYATLLDPAEVGLPVSVFVQVSLERQVDGVAHRLAQFVHVRHDRVSQFVPLPERRQDCESDHGRFSQLRRVPLADSAPQFEAVRATCAHAAVVAARPGGYVT